MLGSTGSTLVVGGLGGGGDVALALMLARAMGVGDEDIAVASFLNCSAARSRLRALAVEGSLIRIPPNSLADTRVFEDKLHLAVPGLRGRVYAICTRDPWSHMVQGLTRLLRDHRPGCMIHTDIGGDGAVLGYESSLGSYKTDTIAKALLAEAAEHGVGSLVAVACLGCEGGGELDETWLAASVLYAMRRERS